jgi:hypothetical protein
MFIFLKTINLNWIICKPIGTSKYGGILLSYDFSTFLLMENSCANIFGYSIFQSVKRPYVFTIVFLSYPMYSHDFSCFSPDIMFYRTAKYIFAEEELNSKHFPKSDMW